MALLHYLSYAAILAALGFLVLSLACGLLWISELIEEHSRMAKVLGQRGIYAIILIHVLLYFFDSLPSLLLLFSIICHLVYLQNFTIRWPVVSLTSLSFMASCILVVVDHFLWFFYFSRITQQARLERTRMYRGQSKIPGFQDIATLFVICVWLAPLFLFLSLSAADNTLPTSSGLDIPPGTPLNSAQPAYHTSRASLFRRLVDTLPIDKLPRMRSSLNRHRDSDGLIAPRSPNPSRMFSGPPLSPDLRTLNDLPPSPLLRTRMSSEALPLGFHLTPHSKRILSPARATDEGPGRVGLGRRLTSDSSYPSHD